MFHGQVSLTPECAYWWDVDKKEVDLTQEPQSILGLRSAGYDGGKAGRMKAWGWKQNGCLLLVLQAELLQAGVYPLNYRLEFSSLQELNGPQKKTVTFWHLGNPPAINIRYLPDSHLNSQKSFIRTQSTSPAFQHSLIYMDGCQDILGKLQQERSRAR